MPVRPRRLDVDYSATHYLRLYNLYYRIYYDFGGASIHD